MKQISSDAMGCTFAVSGKISEFLTLPKLVFNEIILRASYNFKTEPNKELRLREKQRRCGRCQRRRRRH